MKEAFKITCSALPDSTRVAAFRGTEAISRLYQFDIYLNVPTEGQDVDLEDAVGAKATLEVRTEDGGAPFTFHGIFAAFELINQEGDNAYFHAVLVPQLWQLTQTFHSRIFTQKSIPDIIKAVLEDGGLGDGDFTLQLSDSYKPEEHVCQYKESHFDFISRWMEREGMYYFFEQGDASEKLVITDNKPSHVDLGKKPVRFQGGLGHDASAAGALHTFTCKHRALPAGVKLKDYNYAKPTLDVSGDAPVSKTGLGEISVYGGRFFSPDDGKRLAKLRAEELLARQVLYHGTGTAPYLRPGYTFKLEEHPRAAFEMQYLAIEVEHSGNDGIENPELRRLTGIEGDRIYSVEVTAIPASTQFRAESRTSWPRIYGYEDGSICGPADSDYAQIDDQGRYNVKFKFDESDLKDGKASTFVRMMQPHGGDIEGFHFPLRKSTEIVFSFLGGDPDRPVISGVVPNLHTPSPVTKANHTTNVLQTGGRNRFELEDKQGQERITLQTPHTNTMIRMGAPNDDHNLICRTDGTCLLHADSHWDVTIGGHLDERVTGTVYEQYSNTRDTHVHGIATENWDSNLSIYVNGQTAECFHGPHKINSQDTRIDEVNGVCTEIYHSAVGRTYYNSLEQTVSTGTALTYHSGLQETVDGGITRTVTGNITETVTGDWTQNITGSFKQTVTAPTTWTWLASHVQNKLSPTMMLNLAISSTTTIGATFDNFIGIKLGITASLGASFAMGVNLEMNAAVKLEIKPTKLKNATMELVFNAMELSTSATALYNKGVLLIS